MNDFSPHPRAGGPRTATTSDEDTVAVRTRVWCTAVMITVSAFMCLVQTSFAATRYINNPVNAMYVWFIASSLLAFAFPVPAACTRQAPGTGVLDLLRRHIDLSL